MTFVPLPTHSKIETHLRDLNLTSSPSGKTSKSSTLVNMSLRFDAKQKNVKLLKKTIPSVGLTNFRHFVNAVFGLTDN